MFRDTTVASDDSRIVVARHSCVVVAFDVAPLEVVDFCCDAQRRIAVNSCKSFYSEAIELVPATCVQTWACSAEAVTEFLSGMHHLVVEVVFEGVVLV